MDYSKLSEDELEKMAYGQAAYKQNQQRILGQVQLDPRSPTAPKNAKIDYSKLTDDQLNELAYKKPSQDQPMAAKADPNAVRPSSSMGAGEASLRGAASAVPFSGTVSGAMRTLPQFRAMADAFGGNFDAAAGEYQKGFMGFDPSQFSKGRETFNRKEDQAAQDQPVAYTLTKLAAELPQYLAGAEALKAVPALSGSGLMSGLGRSALSNVGVSQVHDYAPEEIPQQLAFGAVGEMLARGAGAALKGAGKLGQYMRFREPGIGGKIAEYGFQPTATGLKNANIKEMEKWVLKMDRLLASKPSLEVPVPRGLTKDSITKIADKIETSGFGGDVTEQASVLRMIGDKIEAKGALNPADSHLLKKSMDELAYAEKGLRNTKGAKQLNGWAREITKKIEGAVGRDYKVINSNLEKTAKIGKQFKTVSTEGVDSKAAFKKSIMPGVLEGGLLTGATVSNPIVSAPAYSAYKLMQTAPVFTGLPALGRFADQTGPAIGAIINEIMAAAGR